MGQLSHGIHSMYHIACGSFVVASVPEKEVLWSGKIVRVRMF